MLDDLRYRVASIVVRTGTMIAVCVAPWIGGAAGGVRIAELERRGERPRLYALRSRVAGKIVLAGMSLARRCAPPATPDAWGQRIERMKNGFVQ
ncbi:hypothetical protein MCBRY_000657 [Methylocystis bryophila]|uniref:Uncharacterized protein n=1 Tax=Methylocystis bryophila TaxID=655015 RepID=A0A1W6MSV5_9HYPH|nr:hypothetical protein B1812_05875 [Methylocystis bryophila]